MLKQHYQADTYRARDSLGYLLKRSHALMHDMLDPILAARGFTFTQYIVMAYVRDGIAINPKDFCAEFRHDSGALTRVIDQLAERGLLERARGVADRRKVDLRLTEAGVQAVEGLIPIVVQRVNTVLGEFSSAEFAELLRLLLKLNGSLQACLEGSTPVAAAGGAPEARDQDDES
jgi:DNA-binding MarR family transcriptional regulator